MGKVNRGIKQLRIKVVYFLNRREHGEDAEDTEITSFLSTSSVL